MSRVLLPEERFIGKILNLFQEIKKKTVISNLFKKKNNKKNLKQIYI